MLNIDHQNHINCQLKIIINDNDRRRLIGTKLL